MIAVRVLCFAAVRELLGEDVLELVVPAGTTVEGLRALLAERAPELAGLSLAQAVNQDYAEAGQELRDGDEVAFIPPISGGSADARAVFVLQREPLDPRALEREARTDHDGAVVTFAGVTRDHNDGARVRGLSYEAYEEMARKRVMAILEAACREHDIGRIRVAHRLGDVPVGEASIVVVVAAAHRGAAFDACRSVMDRIKREVPIFKKEWLDDGSGGGRWVGELPQR